MRLPSPSAWVHGCGEPSRVRRSSKRHPLRAAPAQAASSVGRPAHFLPELNSFLKDEVRPPLTELDMEGGGDDTSLPAIRLQREAGRRGRQEGQAGFQNGAECTQAAQQHKQVPDKHAATPTQSRSLSFRGTLTSCPGCRCQSRGVQASAATCC